MNIILIGMPMSGKSTIGKKAAEILAWDFIDTDQLIEKEYGKTCREIFAEMGERQFRELETQQIASLKGKERHMIAVGGGAVCESANVEMLQLMGDLVYLQAPVSLLWKRMRGVPAYLDRDQPEHAFNELARKRIPLYEAAATYTIDTEHLSEQEIIRAIGEKIDGK